MKATLLATLVTLLLPALAAAAPGTQTARTTVQNVGVKLNYSGCEGTSPILGGVIAFGALAGRRRRAT